MTLLHPDAVADTILCNTVLKTKGIGTMKKKPKDTILVRASLAPATYRRLKIMQAYYGLSVSDTIEKILAKHLPKEPKPSTANPGTDA